MPFSPLFFRWCLPLASAFIFIRRCHCFRHVAADFLLLPFRFDAFHAAILIRCRFIFSFAFFFQLLLPHYQLSFFLFSRCQSHCLHAQCHTAYVCRTRRRVVGQCRFFAISSLRFFFFRCLILLALMLIAAASFLSFRCRHYYAIRCWCHTILSSSLIFAVLFLFLFAFAFRVFAYLRFAVAMPPSHDIRYAAYFRFSMLSSLPCFCYFFAFHYADAAFAAFRLFFYHAAIGFRYADITLLFHIMLLRFLRCHYATPYTISLSLSCCRCMMFSMPLMSRLPPADGRFSMLSLSSFAFDFLSSPRHAAFAMPRYGCLRYITLFQMIFRRHFLWCRRLPIAQWTHRPYTYIHTMSNTQQCRWFSMPLFAAADAFAFFAFRYALFRFAFLSPLFSLLYFRHWWLSFAASADDFRQRFPSLFTLLLPPFCHFRLLFIFWYAMLIAAIFAFLFAIFSLLHVGMLPFSFRCWCDA